MCGIHNGAFLGANSSEKGDRELGKSGLKKDFLIVGCNTNKLSQIDMAVAFFSSKSD